MANYRARVTDGFMVEQEAKHTPAPWIMEHDEEEGTVTVWAGSAIEDRRSGIYDMAGKMELYSGVYLDGNSNASDDECLANGRLIAAAPELYEIVQGMVDAFDGGISCNFQPNCAMASKMRAVTAKVKTA